MTGFTPATPSDELVEWARRLTDDEIYSLACSANTQYLGWNRSAAQDNEVSACLQAIFL